jgi:parallel beta-helix repeat protein
MSGITEPGSDCIFLPFTVPVSTTVQVESPTGSFLVREKVQLPTTDVPTKKVVGLNVHVPFTVLSFDKLPNGLEKCVVNNWASGFYLDDSSSNTLTGNTAKSNHATGFYFYSGSSNSNSPMT